MVMAGALFYYVNHTSQFQYNSGIQRCVRALAKALISEGASLIPVAWDHHKARFVQPGALALQHLAQWNGPSPDSWQVWRDPEVEHEGVLLIIELVCGRNNPSMEDLRSAAPCLSHVWLFHDALPWKLAQNGRAELQAAAQVHATYMHGLGGAELVVCNSHSSRHDLLQFLRSERSTFDPLLQQRILVLPLAEDFGRSRLPAPVAGAASLRMLTVSTLEPRKNHAGLVKALLWLWCQGLRHWQLELVGWCASPEISELIDRARSLGLPIIQRGFLSDEELLACYGDADFCVYPSLEEGFGLPVAESLWHRRPCLCGSNGALSERAAAGGCLSVDTAEWRSIADGLERLLTESGFRQLLSDQIEHRLFRRWSDVARDLLSLLKDHSIFVL